jgi:tetratricopeptide (TPR) repeat protein
MKKPLLALFLLPLAGGAASAAIEPFYEDLLRDGIHAYDRKEYSAAARSFRLACFGMLDEPKRLADCLVRLALAQDRAESLDAFRETFRRIVEVEERFGAYSQGDLPAELRAAFEARVPVRVPAATLEGIAAFRRLAKPSDKAAGGGARPRETSASPSAAKREPAPAPPAAPAPAQVQASQPEPRPLTDAERQTMAKVRKTLDSPNPGNRELKTALQLAREVADAHPDSAEAQHLAAEAAYRLSRWGDAVAYFRRGGDPGEAQPELLFYMAVALFESGDRAGAATALRRSLPSLRKTEYIQSYEKKILGQ